MNSLPALDVWPNRPLLVKRAGSSIITTNEEERNALLKPIHIHGIDHYHSLIPIDTELFSGKMLILIKGLSGIPETQFKNKKREFEIIVQGKFKNNTSGNKMYTGQYFEHEHIKIRYPWLIESILYLIRSFIGDIEVESEAETQYIISPMLTSTQRINVSESGKEPDITGDLNLIVEDFSIQCMELSGKSSAKRKSYFSEG
jgi:hypothetical protein